MLQQLATRRCSAQLYVALDVQPTATEDEIKAAYHEKVAEYKNVPDKAEEYERVKDAEDVLLNGNRRRLYDLFGRDGLRMIEGGFGAEYIDLVVENVHHIRKIFLTLAFIVLMMLVEEILLIRQVDDHLGAPWALLFIPVWLADLAAVGLFFGTFTNFIKHPIRNAALLPQAGVFASVVASTITICLALSGLVTYHVGFLPVLFLLGFYVFSSFRNLSLNAFREESKAAGDPDWDNVQVTSLQFLFYLAKTIYMVACLVVFGVLLWLQATALININWLLVFLPLFMWLWTGLAWRLFITLCTSRVYKHYSDRLIACFLIVYCYTGSIMTVGLLAVKARQWQLGVHQLSLIYCLMPTMFVTVIILGLMCFLALLLPTERLTIKAKETISGYTKQVEDPLLEVHRGAQTANTFTYATQQAARGRAGKAATAAMEGVRLAQRHGADYGALSETEMRAADDTRAE